MAYPIATNNPNAAYTGATTGYPGYTGVAGSGYSGVFIPEIWSTKMIEKYYDGTCLSKISNTNYEGEIRNQGDKVIIRTHPTITIRDYTIGQTLQTEFPRGGKIELTIDKGKYWQFAIDDVIEKQQDLNQMNDWATDASEQLKIVMDTEVLAYLPLNVAAGNTGAAAGRISGSINLGTTAAALAVDKTNIVDVILDLGQVLDEQNVPETGRFLVMPFSLTNALKKSDLKAAYLTGDSVSPLRNGLVGRVDRFEIYNSNLLPTAAGGGTAWSKVILAGYKDAFTFAAQLTKTETLRSHQTFGDYMRGLMIYGYKMIKPEAMAVAYIR